MGFKSPETIIEEEAQLTEKEKTERERIRARNRRYKQNQRDKAKKKKEEEQKQAVSFFARTGSDKHAPRPAVAPVSTQNLAHSKQLPTKNFSLFNRVRTSTPSSSPTVSPLQPFPSPVTTTSSSSSSSSLSPVPSSVLSTPPPLVLPDNNGSDDRKNDGLRQARRHKHTIFQFSHHNNRNLKKNLHLYQRNVERAFTAAAKSTDDRLSHEDMHLDPDGFVNVVIQEKVNDSTRDEIAFESNNENDNSDNNNDEFVDDDAVLRFIQNVDSSNCEAEDTGRRSRGSGEHGIINPVFVQCDAFYTQFMCAKNNDKLEQFLPPG